MPSGLRQKRPGTPLRHMLFYGFAAGVVRVLMRVIYRARAFGAGRVPATGAVLLVANHQSYLDPPLVGISIRNRHLDYLARAGLFESPVMAKLLRGLNSVPIKEDGGDASAIKEILRRLEKGYAVLIFPEGTRSPDGTMQPFKRGVAVLVKRAKCPVVPVAVEGCFDAWPRERAWPRFLGQRIAVAFGDPIPHAELMADGPDAALAKLEARVGSLRMVLRRWLRWTSHGQFPPVGAADGITGAVVQGLPDAAPSAGGSQTAAGSGYPSSAPR